MTLQGLRILVAEDNLLEADIVQKALAQVGCDVIGPVPRLTDALDIVQRQQLDGALLDINLNGVNSFAAAWRLQERRVPFAFMSGYPRSVIPGPGPLRTVPFITKPLDEQDLLRTVARFVPDEPTPPTKPPVRQRRMKRRQYNL